MEFYEGRTLTFLYTGVFASHYFDYLLHFKNFKSTFRAFLHKFTSLISIYPPHHHPLPICITLKKTAPGWVTSLSSTRVTTRLSKNPNHLVVLWDLRNKPNLGGYVSVHPGGRVRKNPASGH